MNEVDPRAIRAASDVLEYSGLVAIPTETVYGLGANADDETAVKKIFEAKGRPQNRPLSVLISGEEAIGAWAKNVPQTAYTLARRFWPGPLTMILHKGDRAGDWITGGQTTIGLRAPGHPWALALLKAFAGKTHRGIAAPSANTFGKISPTSAKHVMDDLGQKPRGKVDLILDGGDCNVGIESTIIDLTVEPPAIVRQGAISQSELEEALGISITKTALPAAVAAGSNKNQYAPKTPVTVIANMTELDTINAKRMVVMACNAPITPLPKSIVQWIECENEPSAYARTLYARLHDLDGLKADRIVIVLPPEGEAWSVIRDRLLRMAGQH